MLSEIGFFLSACESYMLVRYRLFPLGNFPFVFILRVTLLHLIFTMSIS